MKGTRSTQNSNNIKTKELADTEDASRLNFDPQVQKIMLVLKFLPPSMYGTKIKC